MGRSESGEPKLAAIAASGDVVAMVGSEVAWWSRHCDLRRG